MKTLFGIGAVIGLSVVGFFAYKHERSAINKSNDWARVRAVPAKITTACKAVGNYFSTLFSSKPVAPVDTATTEAA